MTRMWTARSAAISMKVAVGRKAPTGNSTAGNPVTPSQRGTYNNVSTVQGRFICGVFFVPDVCVCVYCCVDIFFLANYLPRV